jgi:hypothetical protein
VRAAEAEEPKPIAPPPARESLGARVVAAWLPPLVALLAGWCLLAWRAAAQGLPLLSPSTWARFDSGHYLSIARGGYAVRNCQGGPVPPIPASAHDLCGNAAWFPGYPAAIRGLSWLTGASAPLAGLIVAWVCWYLVLVLIWRLLAGARSRPSRWACVLIAAFFPGQVYFAALFPVSLTIAGMLCCLEVALRGTRRWRAGAASLSGFVAAYSYIIAVVLAPALAVTAFSALRDRRDRLRALLPALAVVAGLGAVLLTIWQAVRIWNIYFLIEEKYEAGAHFPLASLLEGLRPLWTPQPPTQPFRSTAAAQTLLTLCLVLLAVAVTIGRVARRTVSATDLTLLLAAVAAWLVPHIAGGQVSIYRSEAFVILTVPLLRRLPPWLLAVPLVAAVLVAARMATWFFEGKLM